MLAARGFTPIASTSSYVNYYKTPGGTIVPVSAVRDFIVADAMERLDQERPFPWRRAESLQFFMGLAMRALISHAPEIDPAAIAKRAGAYAKAMQKELTAQLRTEEQP